MALPKEKDKRGGITSPVYLVHELCYMAGMSDQQRGDFRLMKDVGNMTNHHCKNDDWKKNLFKRCVLLVFNLKKCNI